MSKLQITILVADTNEGGYYHPVMLQDGRIKDKRYASSGETFLGLDRKNGVALSRYPQWNQFWAIIDKAGAKDKWAWNYGGGEYRGELLRLASEIMLSYYETLCKRYMSAELKEIVDRDKRLTYHFVYACWNGSGWFKKWATEMKIRIRYDKDVDGLAKYAIAQRTEEGYKTGSKPNSLIAQGGRKMAKMFENIDQYLA